MSAKHSFVVLLDYADDLQESVLEPLNLTVVTNESDIALGYYTVTGTAESIAELKSYLNSSSYI